MRGSGSSRSSSSQASLCLAAASPFSGPHHLQGARLPRSPLMDACIRDLYQGATLSHSPRKVVFGSLVPVGHTTSPMSYNTTS